LAAAADDEYGDGAKNDARETTRTLTNDDSNVLS